MRVNVAVVNVSIYSESYDLTNLLVKWARLITVGQLYEGPASLRARGQKHNQAIELRYFHATAIIHEENNQASY